MVLFFYFTTGIRVSPVDLCFYADPGRQIFDPIVFDQFFLIQSIFKGLPPVEPGGFIDGESDLDPVTGLPVPRPKPQV